MPTQREIERSIVERAAARGMEPEQIREAILKFRETYAQPDAGEKAAAEEPSGAAADLRQAGKGIAESLGRRGEQIKETARQSFDREINPLRAGLRYAGSAAGAVTDVLAGGLVGGVKALLPKGAEDYLAEKGRALMGTGVGKAAASAVSAYEKWKDENPEIAKDVEAAGNIASLLPVEKAVGLGVRGAETAAKAASEAAAGAAGGAVRVTRQATRTAGDVATVLAEKGKGAASFIAGTPERLNVAAEAAKESAKAVAKEAPVVRKAVQSGFTPREAVIISKAAPKEKAVFRQMTQAAKDMTAGKPVRSPADVAGSFLQKRLADADELRKEAGKKLGESVKSLKGEVVAARQRTLKRLQEVPGMEDIRIDNLGNLDFRNTTASLDTAVQKEINAYWNAIKGRDAYRLHQLRQEIFETLGGRQKAAVPLTATQEQGLEAIRQGLADAIGDVSGNYRALNQEYAKIANPLKNLRKFYRGLENASDDVLDERAGILLRRLTGNSPSAQNLKQAIAEIDDILASAGKKADVDLNRLQDFQNILEREYMDIVKDTGFAGQSALGVKKGLGLLVDKAVEAIGNVAGITPEYRRAVLDELLTDASKARGGQPQIIDPSKFERAANLSPENKAIEDAAFAKVLKDEDKLLDDYVRQAKYGEEKVVNADEFRPLFKDVGYAGHNAAAVQEPSSYLAKRQFTRLLEKNKKSPYAVYSAGGSGAGKSSALSNVPGYSKMKESSAVILDSNMSSYSSAKKKLAEAAAAGKKNHVYFVYRDIEDAFVNGVVKRMRDNPKEMGRLVPTNVVADNHVGSWDVIRALEDEGVKVTYVDNSLGFGKARKVTRKQLESKIKYPSKEALAERLNDVAKRLRDEGIGGIRITDDQYRGFIGR